MIKTKVLIAGGGPAGAATSLSLSHRGIPNIVAEASHEPMPRPGETIPPNAIPLFTKLGIEPLLQSPQHVKSYGNRFIWGNEQFADKDFIFGVHSHGLHIDRMHFEIQMLQSAAERGATVLTGTRVKKLEKCNIGWSVQVSTPSGGTEEIQCEFIADATGRASRIARAISVQRIFEDKLAGVTAYFPGSEHGNPFYTFVEAVEQGWWYAVPLSQNRIATAFMTDTDLMVGEMLKPQGFKLALEATKLISSLPQQNTETAMVTTCSASTSYLAKRHGDRWLAVGDAAFAYDPISSYGITSALEGGFYAGNAIADHMGGFAEALPAYDWIIGKAFSVFMEMYVHQYRQETRWERSEFWKRRQN